MPASFHHRCLQIIVNMKRETSQVRIIVSFHYNGFSVRQI